MKAIISIVKYILMLGISIGSIIFIYYSIDLYDYCKLVKYNKGEISDFINMKPERINEYCLVMKMRIEYSDPRNPIEYLIYYSIKIFSSYSSYAESISKNASMGLLIINKLENSILSKQIFQYRFLMKILFNLSLFIKISSLLYLILILLPQLLLRVLKYILSNLLFFIILLIILEDALFILLNINIGVVEFSLITGNLLQQIYEAVSKGVSFDLIKNLIVKK